MKDLTMTHLLLLGFEKQTIKVNNKGFNLTI